MKRVRVSAPGKIVILGEYAVLEGAPAVVMAVDRRARVSLEQQAGSRCSIEAPGWSRGPVEFRLDPSGRVLFGDRADRLSLVTHVAGEFFKMHGGAAACPPFHLVLDSRTLMEQRPAGPVKLGLGSSAALTVALCQALSYYVASQQDPVQPGLADLVRIHAGLQGGRGSGLDVAAGLHGGLIEYRCQPAPRAAAFVLPEALEYCFVWSGDRADTGTFLATVDAWRGRAAAEYGSIMAGLAEAAELGVRAGRGRDGGTFLRALDDYVSLLQELGKACKVDILSPPHQRLRELARQAGVVYKPCGAGGGDIGLGIATDPEALAGFRSAALAANFQLLSLERDDLGVHTQSED
jgi:phosphomevalonate kinase